MSTIYEQYLAVISNNVIYNDYKARWQFYLDSYMGGEDYRSGGHLTRYTNESPLEYNARLASTPLDNHCRSVISVYTSFLFRKNPERELDQLEYSDMMLKDYLKDTDLDGRGIDAFMKEVSIWSNVFGHCWVLLTKPNIGATTMADEIALGVRPYANLLTPLTVIDWSWQRSMTGAYTLDYIKYVEDVNGDIQIIKEWTPELINTYEIDNNRKEVKSVTTEINGLGLVPAVICYGNRGPMRGIGISDLSDIADHQKKIYNELSEVEQSIRLNGHPALVKTPDVEASAGAGAIVSMPDNLDPGLKPYMLTVSTDIASIYNSIDNSIAAIDKMANTGAVRATEVRTLSGVAMRTEFELLNAKLSEKADNLELAEEQMWKLYCLYQGKTWEGKIEYPGSFNIQDDSAEFGKLLVAKQTATDPRVLALIDHEVIEMLGEDADVIMPEMVTLASGTEVPYDSAEPFEEPEELYNPETGESGWVIDFESKREAMLAGWVEKE